MTTDFAGDVTPRRRPATHVPPIDPSEVLRIAEEQATLEADALTDDAAVDAAPFDDEPHESELERAQRQEREEAAAIQDEGNGYLRPTSTRANASRSGLLAFPVGALPDVVATFVNALADELEVAPDMPATFALGALSAALIGKVVVAPKERWREPPILYVCLVADAGQRKSPTLNRVIAPLYRIEKEERKRWKELCDQMDAESAKLAIITENSKKQKGRPKDKAADKPPMPRFIMGDVTPEELACTLAEAKNNRLAMLSDEATVLEMAAGMYSARPNIDVYLKSWDRSAVIVDRKMSGSLFVEHPSLTMVQCAQRGVFSSLAKHPELRNKGLLPRFLFSVPTSTRGYRTHNRPPVDPQVESAWGELVSALYYWEPGTSDAPKVVWFDRLAQEELLRFQRWLEKHIAPGARFDDVGDMADKIVGAMVRISLVLWCAESTAEERDDRRSEISGSTVRRAIEIATYFLRHSEHVLVNLLSAPNGADAANALWTWVKARGLREFLWNREFQQKGPRALRKSKDKTTAAANLLVDRGLLERAGPGWLVLGSGDAA